MGSIFLAFADTPSDFVRDLAGYSGVEIDADGSTVVDYFTSKTDPTLFASSNYPKVRVRLVQ